MTGLFGYFPRITREEAIDRAFAQATPPSQDEPSSLKYDKKIGFYKPISSFFSQPSKSESSKASFHSEGESSESATPLTSLNLSSSEPVTVEDNKPSKKRVKEQSTIQSPKRRQVSIADKENEPASLFLKSPAKVQGSIVFGRQAPKVKKIEHLDLSAANSSGKLERALKNCDYPIKITFPRSKNSYFNNIYLSVENFQLLANKGAFIEELDLSSYAWLSRNRNTFFRDEMSKFRNLKVLDLSGHKGLTKNTVIRIIKNAKKLEKIYLGACDYKEKEIDGIKKEFRSRFKTVKIETQSNYTLDQQQFQAEVTERISQYSRSSSQSQ